MPLHDDVRLFEFLILEGAQAGLSWSTILSKREAYRRAFVGFDPRRVARFTESKIARLLADPGIVRNELKIRSAVKNARAVLAIQERHGSLDAFLWQFGGNGEPMSAALKKAGCTFVGPTICYAFMQAVGMVNDHAATCFRRAQIRRMQRSV